MMAGRPQATRWNHWDCASIASCPHFREADRNQQAVSITHLHSKGESNMETVLWIRIQGHGIDKNSLCPLTTPHPSLAGRSECTMSPPPPPIQPFVQNNLEINSDMKSALDRPP